PHPVAPSRRPASPRIVPASGERIDRRASLSLEQPTSRSLVLSVLKTITDYAHNFIEEHSISRDCISGSRCTFAAPICECASRLFHDRQESRTVPKVHYRIQHHISSTRCN